MNVLQYDKPSEEQEVLWTAVEQPPAPMPVSEDRVKSDVDEQARETDMPNCSASNPECDSVISHHIMEDFGVAYTPATVPKTKWWKYVTKRVVKDGTTGRILFQDVIGPHVRLSKIQHKLPSSVSHIITDFEFCIPKHVCLADLPRDEGPMQTWTEHQARQIQAQATEALFSANIPEAPLVVEVFSPPRFAPVAQGT